jgi:crotonobetainyl-CoA:carnitine CoA-transferase CaiB-like acyl-CoA transferase
LLKQRDYQPNARGPLDGVRILDLSRLVAGNTLTGVLADFGAEVVKVEPAAGDTLRAWRTKDVQVNWKLYARNKKSLALELRKPEARELLLKLVEISDVFVESFRPDTLEKMGLGPDVLLARNPRIVIVRISGWGKRVPTVAAPASALSSRASPVLHPSTVSPIASRSFPRCTWPIPMRASTARRRS